MHPFLSNMYLILIFIGVILLLIKLHDLKGLIKTFISEISVLASYINALDAELHKEEENIEVRVDRLSRDIVKILKEIDKKNVK